MLRLVGEGPVQAVHPYIVSALLFIFFLSSFIPLFSISTLQSPIENAYSLIPEDSFLYVIGCVIVTSLFLLLLAKLAGR